MNTSYLISITGIVQGVGFRPYIYNLANSLSLFGWILNNSNGVIIHIEGPKDKIDNFLYIIEKKPPTLSKISNITLKKDIFNGYTSFTIKDSKKSNSSYIFISPDVATCDICKCEILSKNNKRYFYPFTNCTNCGPRFSIIKNIPYDRKVTTMSRFEQCSSCSIEYTNFKDRRFHAQPNCCPTCGPKLFITNSFGVDITDNIIDKSKINSKEYNKKLILFFESMINSGKIFAIKSLSGFHLCCTPYSYETVNILRQRKKRPGKPFALMMRNIDTIKKYCYVSKFEEDMLLSSSRPIVLLRKLNNINLPNNVAPNNNYLGIMLPSTPLQILIFEGTNIEALIMTSGNLSGLPLEYSNKSAIDSLASFTDYFLLNNRDIYLPLDDSILKEFNGLPMMIRKSRGYSPSPIYFNDCGNILALGSDMKNTFSISKNKYIYTSPHQGDLINYECLSRFKENLAHYIRLFKLSPKTIACDLHPNYESTKLSFDFNLPKVMVQHHHAHIVSCMIDNSYENTVIGIAFDGTGYGDDNCIWGSEFLICNFNNYKRVGHLDYIPFLGGDSVLKDSYKIALSYLYHSFNGDITLLQKLLSSNYRNTYKTIYKLLNNPNLSYKSSSMGRLFDGISSLLGLCHKATYEGEAAILLESILKDDKLVSGYKFSIQKEDNVYILNSKEIIKDIVLDINNGVTKEDISLKFHSTIVNYIIEMSSILRKEYDINIVALSGGVFQNNYLLKNSYNELTKIGFKVLVHKNIPPNDAGISIGQIVIAKNNK